MSSKRSNQLSYAPVRGIGPEAGVATESQRIAGFFAGARKALTALPGQTPQVVFLFFVERIPGL